MDHRLIDGFTPTMGYLSGTASKNEEKEKKRETSFSLFLLFPHNPPRLRPSFYTLTPWRYTLLLLFSITTLSITYALDSPSSPSPSSSSSSPSPPLLPEAFQRATAWGTYRPATFFSVKSSMHAHGLLTGLAWGGEGVWSEGEKIEEERRRKKREEQERKRKIKRKKTQEEEEDEALWGNLSGTKEADPSEDDGEEERLYTKAESVEIELESKKREKVYHHIQEEDIIQDEGKCLLLQEKTQSVCEGVRFTWEEHDGIYYGSQVITHTRRKAASLKEKKKMEDLKIRTTFVKHPSLPDQIFSYRISATLNQGTARKKTHDLSPKKKGRKEKDHEEDEREKARETKVEEGKISRDRIKKEEEEEVEKRKGESSLASLFIYVTSEDEDFGVYVHPKMKEDRSEDNPNAKRRNRLFLLGKNDPAGEDFLVVVEAFQKKREISSSSSLDDLQSSSPLPRMSYRSLLLTSAERQAWDAGTHISQMLSSASSVARKDEKNKKKTKKEKKRTIEEEREEEKKKHFSSRLLDRARTLSNTEDAGANFIAIQILGVLSSQREEEDEEEKEEGEEEGEVVVDVHFFMNGVLSSSSIEASGARKEEEEKNKEEKEDSLKRERKGTDQIEGDLCDYECLSSLSIEEIDRRINRLLHFAHNGDIPKQNLSSSSSSSLPSSYLTFFSSFYSRLFHRHLSHVFPPRESSSSSSLHSLRSQMIANLLGSRGYFTGDLPVTRFRQSRFSSSSSSPKSGGRGNSSLSSTFFHDDNRVGQEEDENEEDEESLLSASSSRQQHPHKKKEQRLLPFLLPDIEMFSFVPSRVKFPRAFLWDEGFHLLVARPWNSLLALQNLSSWMGLIHQTDLIADGWIPREVTLNDEMMFGLPEKFFLQDLRIGSPPTLIFAIEELLESCMREFMETSTKTKQAEFTSSSSLYSSHPLFSLLEENISPSHEDIEDLANVLLDTQVTKDHQGENRRKEKKAFKTEQEKDGEETKAMRGVLLKILMRGQKRRKTSSSFLEMLIRFAQETYPLLKRWISYYATTHTCLIPDAPYSTSSSSSVSSSSSSSSLPLFHTLLLEPRRYPQWHRMPSLSAPSFTFSSGLDDFPRPLQVLSQPRNNDTFEMEPYPSPVYVHPGSMQRQEGREASSSSSSSPPAAHLDLHVWLMSLISGTYQMCRFLRMIRRERRKEQVAGQRDEKNTKMKKEEEDDDCQAIFEPVLAALVLKLLGTDAPRYLPRLSPPSSSSFSSLSSHSCPSSSSLSFSSSSSAASSSYLCGLKPPFEPSVYFHEAGLLVDFATNQPLVRTRKESEGAKKEDDERTKDPHVKDRLVPVPVWPWREDGRCGPNFPVKKSGRPSVCNPLSDSPCCSPSGYCGSTPGHCNCRGCFRSPPLSDQSFWSYAAIGSAPSPHVGVPSLLPLALGYLPIYSYLPGLLFSSSSSFFFFLDGVDSDAKTSISSSSFSSFSGYMRERERSFFSRQGEREKEEEPLLLQRLLEVVRSEELGLTSRYGLRSLRKGDGMYHAGGNYWRGDVWIHITYLVLRGLQKFYLPFFSEKNLSSTSSQGGEKTMTKKQTKRKNKKKGSGEEEEEEEDDECQEHK
ncbi:mannosyl-oligosaccharide glucosidase, partial [Cystoisospora suis]